MGSHGLLQGHLYLGTYIQQDVFLCVVLIPHSPLVHWSVIVMLTLLNEFSSINVSHEHMLYSRSRRSERSLILVYRLYSVSVNNACHNGMARPQVADGGDGLQMWRVAANILNKQSRTADKGWSSSLGVGRGANNSSP
jgi:hypothetical protein